MVQNLIPRLPKKMDSFRVLENTEEFVGLLMVTLETSGLFGILGMQTGKILRMGGNLEISTQELTHTNR